ncbi:MAG: DUF1566 domain-containing protein [Candidatus Korobacteraceae bacterium]|jgi:hypothetical protein
MLPAIRRWSYLACLILASALLAGAQLLPDVTPEQRSQLKSQPKSSAMLKITTDLECDWTLDGVSQGRLKASEVKSMRVSPGEYLVRATSADGMDSWQTAVTVGQLGQKLVQVPLSGVRQARREKEQKEQKEAAERRREEERQREEVRKQEELRKREEERKQEEVRRRTWTDPATGLMWARQDNGNGVNLDRASNYCRNLSLVGYANWRLPAIDELAGIYDPTQNVNDYHIKGGIHVSGWTWSTTSGTGEAWAFHFGLGRRFSYPLHSGLVTRFSHPLGHSNDFRALCVRRSGE